MALTLPEGGRCFQAVDMTIVFDIFMVRERVPLHKLYIIHVPIPRYTHL